MNHEMTASRLIPFGTHGALELLVGLATMVAPFVFGFSAAAGVIAVVVGAALVGLSLSSTTDERGRPALSVSMHHAADYGIAFGLAGSATLVALAGDPIAGLVLAIIAATHLALNSVTRYSARG